MSAFKLLLLIACVSLTLSQNTICVWNGEEIRNAQNGEYTLAGTRTTENGDSLNYWEKSSQNCPQYLQPAWFAEDNIHYWVLYETLTNYGDHIMSECGDDWEAFPENPTLCVNGWDDWRSGSSVAISITVTAGNCPSLTCPALQVTNSGISSCDQLFIKDTSKDNVFIYNSAASATTTYLYFNANTFKWYCSNTLDTDNCDDDDSITHHILSSKNDGWTDVSIGGQFTLTLSNDNDALLQCIAATNTLNPTNAVTSTPTQTPTTSPSRTPTQMPTISPNISPTLAPTKSPNISPSSAPTKSPVKAIVSPTESPAKSPIIEAIKPTTTTNVPSSPVQDPATTEAQEDTTESDEEPQSVQRNPLIFQTWLIIIVACMVTMVVCCVIMWPIYVLYKVKKKNSAADDANMMESTVDGKIAATMEGNKSDVDRNPYDEIYGWFEFEVGFGHYAAMFVEYGYDSLKSIMCIHDRNALKSIGVHKVGHLTLIWSEIKKLRAKHGIPEEKDDAAAPGALAAAEHKERMQPTLPPMQEHMQMQLNNTQMVDDLIHKQKIRILQLQSQPESDGEGYDEVTDTWKSDVFFAKQYDQKDAFQVTKGSDLDSAD